MKALRAMGAGVIVWALVALLAAPLPQTADTTTGTDPGFVVAFDGLSPDVPIEVTAEQEIQTGVITDFAQQDVTALASTTPGHVSPAHERSPEMNRARLASNFDGTLTRHRWSAFNV